MTGVRDHTALLAFLAARQNMPFSWGQNDCVLFAAGAIRALTGRDALADIGAWSNQREALARLKELGGLAAAVDGVLTALPPALAQRGDIGMIESQRGPALVVVCGLTLAGPGEHGIEHLPREALIQSWSATA